MQPPNGAIEQIRYSGDVPPSIVLVPDAATEPVPSLPVAFDEESPFAMLQRISAEMDREAAVMFQAANSLVAQPMPGPDALTEAALGGLPAGSEGYSFISTFSGNGVCTRSVQVTYQGNGQPQVVSKASGNCGGVQGPATSTELPALPARAPQSRTIEIRSNGVPVGTKPYQGLLHEVSDWQR